MNSSNTFVKTVIVGEEERIPTGTYRQHCEVETNLRNTTSRKLYGEVCGMLNEAKKGGRKGTVIPPKQWKRIAGIPIPPLKEYKFNAIGRCCICNEPDSERYPGPIYHVNEKGRKRKMTSGGYCDPCGDDRWVFLVLVAIEYEIWHGMMRLGGDDAFRRVLYGLLAILPIPVPLFPEWYVDPRKNPDEPDTTVAGGRRYNRRRDRKNPDDVGDEALAWAIIQNGKEQVALGKQLLRKKGR